MFCQNTSPAPPPKSFYHKRKVRSRIVGEKYMCDKLYKGYEKEAFFSMFGMLTGTISSGVLLLREIDPELKTPASSNLVLGSSFGVGFGFPVLLLVNFAGKSEMAVWISFGIVLVYLALLLFLIFKTGKKNKVQK